MQYSTSSLFLLGGLHAVASLQVTLAATNSSAISPVILADTNRDGAVDDSDLEHRHQWTDSHGAIFLPNIGDRTHRCASVDLAGLPLSNLELASCNDAAGDRLITPYVAARVKTQPIHGLSKDAVGRIHTMPEAARDRVRVFWGNGGAGNDSADWTLINSQFEFNATSLSQGLALAVDGRELVSDSNIWDGSVQIVFEVIDGQRQGSDFAALKQAPVLVHHHLQQVDTFLTLQTNESVSVWQAPFVKSLTDIAGRLHRPPPLRVLNNSNEVWGQDFMEPAFVSMPGPDGPISLRVLIRSANPLAPTADESSTSCVETAWVGGSPGRGRALGGRRSTRAATSRRSRRTCPDQACHIETGGFSWASTSTNTPLRR